MKRKRRLKFKIFMLGIFLIVLLISSMYVYKLMSSYYHSETKKLYVNSYVISFDCTDDYKYIHLQMVNKAENPIKYSLINPSGKTVGSGELSAKTDYFCNSEKGIWKVSFELNKEVEVDYKVWEGNLKFRDKLRPII